MSKSETEYAIEVLGLHKNFRKFKRYREMLMHPFSHEKIPALCGVDLKVKKGELFMLLGPNGAGKTTLIKTLCTLILPNEGTAFVNGYDILKDGDAIRRSIGYIISEERSFYWRLTGRQNLKFFAALYNLYGKEADRRVNEVLEIIDLVQVADKMFMDYSTGMRQKMSVARGLIIEPELLFMDEPTRSLDPTIATRLREFVCKYLVKERGMTVFFSTHNLYEAEISDSLAIIHKGKIRLKGPLNEIRKEGRNFLIGLKKPENGLLNTIGRMDMVHSLKSLPQRPEGPELELAISLDEKKGDISDLIAEIVRLRGKILFCSPHVSSLLEIFQQATSEP